jgi:dTDP-4-amino-4,6-dideoxygalactose transaminase
MLNTPFSPWPSFTEQEAEAVKQVVLSNKVNYWTGTECREFEKEFAQWCGAAHAVALSNGTLALDVALKALNFGAGDEVVVTPRTFLASVSCVVGAGAVPVFADVDLNTGNISAQTIAPVITAKTKAIICVHLAGMPCDMDGIMALAAQHGLKVIEDCAQAHGARYKGKSVGTIGHIGAWSFCQDKIMTTGGEGGMVTTNDKALWAAMWAYKDHGKSYAAVSEKEHAPGFRWLHESFGTNWRMLEVQAVLGRIQLKKMSAWTAARTHNARMLAKACAGLTVVRVPNVQSLRCASTCNEACGSNVGCSHAFYKFYAHINPSVLAPGWSRDRIVESINKQGVPCFQGSCSEVYLEKAFDLTGWRPNPRLPNAKLLGETSLMMLIHPILTQNEMAKACEVLRAVLLQATHP